MGYVRLWRHKQLVPGIQLNVSKSGPSLSFGPGGAAAVASSPRRDTT